MVSLLSPKQTVSSDFAPARRDETKGNKKGGMRSSRSWVRKDEGAGRSCARKGARARFTLNVAVRGVGGRVQVRRRRRGGTLSRANAPRNVKSKCWREASCSSRFDVVAPRPPLGQFSPISLPNLPHLFKPTRTFRPTLWIRHQSDLTGVRVVGR